MSKGAWPATVSGAVKESDTTEQLNTDTHIELKSIVLTYLKAVVLSPS